MTATMQSYDTEKLTTKLREWWGYDAFREGQLAVIGQVMSGEDTLALMPTGAGKSLCYQLPAMLREGVTLVISPLIALMKDQYDNLPPEVYPQATFINSSLDTKELEQRLDDVLAGRYKLVYAAPERLRQLPFLDALKRAGLGLLVIDEAHCVSLWGHDFRPDYLFIRKALPLLGQPQVLGLTATATPQMQGEIGEQLGRKLRIVQLSSFRPNLRYEVHRANNAETKLRLLVELCQDERGSGIVYATSRANCETIAQTLYRNHIKAEFYHAGLDGDERSAVQERFMLDRTRVIVATVAFGMGIDKANVRFIAHYNMPKSLEAYAQESGRAGRDGKPARCLLIFNTSDKVNLNRWARGEQLDKPLLRSVYKAVREAVSGGVKQNGTVSGLVATGDLVREVNMAGVGDVDETKLKVAISLLERAGLLSRHLDAPRTATVMANDFSTEADFMRFAEAARLRVGQRELLEVPLVAKELQLTPDELEARILGWQAAGLLQYRGGGRDMVLDMSMNPGAAAERIDALLAQLDKAAQHRLDQMAMYAESNRCRHQQIAAHLGEDLPACETACDVCTASPEQRATLAQMPQLEIVANPAAVIMECARSLRRPLGRTGLAQALVGSIAAPVKAEQCANFGKLAYATRKEVTAAIDQLTEQGYFYLDHSGDYPLLAPGPRFQQEPPADLIRLRVKQGSFVQANTNAAAWQSAAVASQYAPPSMEQLDDEAADLFERLRAWRRSTAQSAKQPPFIIANDTTLRAIAMQRPHTLAELSQAYGMGERKVAKYGAAILELLWGNEEQADVLAEDSDVQRHSASRSVPDERNRQKGDSSVPVNDATMQNMEVDHRRHEVASGVPAQTHAIAPSEVGAHHYHATTAVSAANTPEHIGTSADELVSAINLGEAIVECVRSLPVQVHIGELSYILSGSVAAVIKPTRCRNHGIFAKSMTSEIKQAIVKLAEAGYLTLSDDRLPIVGLGQRSHNGEAPPPDLVFVHENPKAGMNREVALEGRLDVPDEDEFTAAQAALYDRLQNWRQRVSLRDGTSLVKIMYSTSLRSIAARHPRTLDELARCYGMDEEKLTRYGAELLALFDTE